MTERRRFNSTFKVRKPKPRDYKEALEKALERAKKGQNRPRKRLGPGPRMKEWANAWKWLKPRLEAAGRTRCEFDHIPHQCSGILTPAHSKKRREIEGDELYEIAIACTNAHQILDERLTHEQMYVAVQYAIERAGGLILPEKRKAA